MKSNEPVIVGFHSGHDCSYSILENGIPVIHEELERITRKKECSGDGLKFFLERQPELKGKVPYFCHCHHEPSVRDLGDPKLFDEMLIDSKKLGGNYYQIGHHKSHAAHAYYSSQFEDAIIFSLDAGGWDFLPDGRGSQVSSVTVFRGTSNKIQDVCLYPMNLLDIGGMWHHSLTNLFGLSVGPPYGNQSGTIMAMAGASTKPVFEKEFLNSFQNKSFYISEHLPVIQKYIAEDCDHKYNVALGLQLATESQIKSLIELHLSDNDVNICLSGGVALNSVMTGKILDWFPQLKNIFIPLVPYDGGLAIGASQYLYHHILGKPKLNNKEYYPPYLGAKHSNSDIYKSLNSKSGEVTVSSATDLDVINLLSCGKIVSIFRGSSESGRRALGNRSILADPRSAGMKDLINEKVKHRQWFRPFAPSILRECVSEWFEKDLESPYMGVVLKFKEDKIDEVPAVCHIDGTGRLQTVSKYMNPWYYNFLNLWKEKSGVPILLNTSFNDREPIVETPLDAIKCFLGTEIDYLFFPETNSLVSKALNE